jgi:hypothetical protein
MKNRLWIVGIISPIVWLSACVSVEPTPSQIPDYYYGSKPSDNEAVETVKKYMSTRLFDPYSAVYECGSPRKARASRGGQTDYGYAISCTINAKNRFGGYVGVQPYNFLLRTGRVILDGWARVEYLD